LLSCVGLAVVARPPNPPPRAKRQNQCPPYCAFPQHGCRHQKDAPDCRSARPRGVAGRALAASGARAVLTRTFEPFRCVRVFREGVENSARGGRAPQFRREVHG
jgi:hypothetical protein